MSRTYRKNSRWFYKYQGKFYTSWDDRTIKGDPRTYEDYDWRCGGHMHGKHFYKEVIVGDSENYHANFCPKEMKKITHRIDRARYKLALLNNEDAHIVSSFDPWDWD